jgi:hypothetical protein
VLVAIMIKQPGDRPKAAVRGGTNGMLNPAPLFPEEVCQCLPATDRLDLPDVTVPCEVER